MSADRQAYAVTEVVGLAVSVAVNTWDRVAVPGFSLRASWADPIAAPDRGGIRSFQSRSSPSRRSR
jgi:hypothetical protein